MISKIITRGILPAVRLCAPMSLCLNTAKFSFGKLEKTSKIQSIIEEELKSETENLNDLTTYEKEFKNGGWTVARENTLVELTKSVGAYTVRLLSNIKTPSQFGDEENEGQ